MFQAAGATTRKAASVDMLKANGADEVFIDSGSIAADVKKAGTFDKVCRIEHFSFSHVRSLRAAKFVAQGVLILPYNDIWM